MTVHVGAAKASDYEVRRVHHRDVRPFVIEHHYARSASNTSVYAFGLYKGGLLVGAALWMPPVLPVEKWARKWAVTEVDRALANEPNAQRRAKIARQAAGLAEAHSLVLSRLVVLDNEPKNAESIFLGAMLRTIANDQRYRIVVTYADEGIAGHTGTIYRATNWTYAPGAYRHPRWRSKDGGLVSPKAGSKSARSGNRTREEMAALGHQKLAPGAVHRYAMVLW